MFARKNKRAAPKGQGAAAAKQVSVQMLCIWLSAVNGVR